MNSTAISRRTALTLLWAAALSPRQVWSQTGQALYLSAVTTRDWRHGAALFDAAGTILARFDLPDRGHGATVDPGGRHAVIFARRPGDYAVVIDIPSRRTLHVIKSRSDRHFYGHGVYSADGRLLFATENDFDSERGVLGVYDVAARYRRVGELPSHGIGPHEVILMPDGETLAVAGGGILTHPSAPRMKLNLSDMEPALIFLNASSGELLRRERPPEEFRRLSLRHLSASRRGDVAMAAQWEGPELQFPPLVGVWSPKQGLRLVSAPAEVQRSMKNYCGSVAFADDGSRFVVSAPRGNVLTEWDAGGTYIGSHSLTDGCGLAPAGPAGFLATGGTGSVVSIAESGGQTPLARHDTLMWDNHITRL